MRSVWLFAFAWAASSLGAQDSTALPREVIDEAAARYNSAAALRVVGRLTVTTDQAIKGDVAVLDGPVSIAGHVGGRLTVINGDLELIAGATVDSGVLVVGGTLKAPGGDSVHVGGPVLVLSQKLRYRMVGERMVTGTEADPLKNWWTHWLHRRDQPNYTDITLSSAHTYNRVEGLPIYVGPSIRRALPWTNGSLSVDALGIVRTENFANWDKKTFGYRFGADIRGGDDPRLNASFRFYDAVDPVENWQLGDGEVGLASFFFRRDYRDYYERQGASGAVSLVTDARSSLTLSLADEHWYPRAERNPFALVPTDDGWRPNPTLDDGNFRLAGLTARIDTRNSETDIWSGWYVIANLEYGNGHVSRFGPRSPPEIELAVHGDSGFVPLKLMPSGNVNYTRLFLDVRRYNRLAPNAQFNVRAVVGGWLSGDPLPLERRLSVGGPGTIPGFDFRSAGSDAPDVASCSAIPEAPSGRPAECERMVLGQAEYRTLTHFAFRVLGHRIEDDFAWVVFADAGRGWLVGPRLGALQYPASTFPNLRTFMTDAGLGFSIDPVGLYVAKALSRPEERPHFVIRVRRTF
ncbi:MAG TPA: BamA/TamA family outer membrane protein [Gemmatimonadaceae bacterium]|nr:BamA/TamA family outer membrane protein [Gemmatimonadaceae bacterium]